MDAVHTEIRPNGHTTILDVPMTPELMRRFWAKVEKTDDCWLWRGRVNPNGMGQMRIASQSKGKQGGTRIDVHRLAYLWYVDDLESDMEIDHLCRVPICVRPSHLEAVSRSENNRRAKNWRVRDKLRAAGLAQVRAQRMKRKKVNACE